MAVGDAHSALRKPELSGLTHTDDSRPSQHTDGTDDLVSNIAGLYSSELVGDGEVIQHIGR